MRRVKIFFLLLSLLATSCAQAADLRLKVLTVDPLMELIVRFIGGPYIETASGWYWDAKDTLRANRAALMSEENLDFPVLALSRAQYEQFETSTRPKPRRGKVIKEEEEERQNLYFLFPDETFGAWEECEKFYGDPANMPFTAQRVMNTLSEILPRRGKYFQRRLGEFNARLSSVLLSGRRSLHGAKILCVSELYRQFFEATGCEVTTPTEDELADFEALAQESSPKEIEELSEKLRMGRIIVLDYHFSPTLRAALETYADAVYIAPPRNEDLLFFIHQMVLLIRGHLDQKK